MKAIIKIFTAVILETVVSCNNDNTVQDKTATDEAAITAGGQENVKDDESQKDVVKVAAGSKDHTTLVAAIKQAELVTSLSNAGPFTVFAPTNAAFDALPAGTVDNLLKPENKATLTSVLTYHVIPGKVDSKSVAKMIKDGKGKAMAKTAQGAELTFSMDGKDLIVTDAKGNKGKVTIADVYQSNGVIHVIDKVLMP